jgi:hypothetical protein
MSHPRAPFALLALLSVLATACPSDLPDGSKIIGNWVASTNVSFESCGTVTAGQCSEWAASPDDEAVMACFTDGLAACTPVRLTQTRPTIEGDPIRETYFVVPRGGDCTVVRFVDTTEDAYGPQQVYRYDCPAATVDASCDVLVGSGCGDWVAMW